MPREDISQVKEKQSGVGAPHPQPPVTSPFPPCMSPPPSPCLHCCGLRWPVAGGRLSFCRSLLLS